MKNLPVTSKDHSLENYQDVVYKIVSENGKEDSVDFHRYLSLLKRKKWIIIAPIIFILPITAMNIYIQKQQYESYATLLIEDVNPKVLTNIQDVINIDRSEDFLTTQFEIIKSRAVSEEVVDILQLHKIPIKEDDEIVKKIKFILEAPSILLNKVKSAIMQLFDYISRRSETEIIISEKDNVNSIDNHRQLIIDQFQNTLIVRPREGTKLVDVGVRGENAQDAAKQANAVVQVYIRQNLEKKLDVARKAVVWPALLRCRCIDFSIPEQFGSGDIQVPWCSPVKVILPFSFCYTTGLRHRLFGGGRHAGQSIRPFCGKKSYFRDGAWYAGTRPGSEPTRCLVCPGPPRSSTRAPCCFRLSMTSSAKWSFGSSRRCVRRIGTTKTKWEPRLSRSITNSMESRRTRRRSWYAIARRHCGR